MSLDRFSLEMIAPHIRGSRVLCLGYPEHPGGRDSVLWLHDEGARGVDVVDVIAHKGYERIVDLNEPQVWPHRYDLIINPGTLEHCFNIGVAWANVWDALAVNGVVLHVAPATMLDHGFWNVCRVALYDWCDANGGQVETMRFGTNGGGHEVVLGKITTSNSGRSQLPPETVVYALCKKVRDVQRTWPTQGCYRR